MDTKIDLADYLQRFSTKVLWHFTGYNKPEDTAYKILTSIVAEKTLKKSDRISIIKMHSRNDRWGYGCSCMCDIPFKDLRIHTSRYGNMGIAFYKSEAIHKGHFNPVLYIHKDHFLFKQAEKLLDELGKLSSPHIELNKAVEQFLRILGTYSKSADLLSEIQFDPERDEDQNNNFYYEREWRSAYDWKFNENAVAAIMLPVKYMKKFRNKIGDKFSNISIISTEMLEIL